MKRVSLRLIYSIFMLLVACNNRIEKINPVSESITESVYAAGIIKAKNQYQVFPTVSGIINKIVVTENDLVKAGSPLLMITDETSTLNRQNAGLTVEYSSLPTNKEKLTDVKNSIVFAESKYKNDLLIYERQKNLWNQNIGSRVELEQKELASQNSKLALEAAKIKYNDLLRQLEFNSAQSKNNLAITKYKEGDLTIKSKINGKVYSLTPEQGEMVNPQTVLAIIGDAKAFLMELQVDEYDIVKIKLGQKILVSMDSYKGKVFDATVSKINPIMNEHSRSFTVEAEFIKQPPALYPFLTVEANIIIQRKDKVVTIPRNYLIDDSLVLIARDKKKVVSTGLKDYQKVEIINGLTANDVIYKPQ